MLKPLKILFAIEVIFLILLSMLTHPHADMSYFWVWSRYPALSYFQHPPMISYWVWLGRSILGNSVFAYKAMALLYGIGFWALMFYLCRKLYDATTSWIFMGFILAAPFFSHGLLFLGPDLPFVVFWMLSMYFVGYAVEQQKIRDFVLLGVCIGLCALSKYIAVLIYFGLGIFALAHKDLRKWFVKPHIYLSGLFSLLVFSPVLWWNAERDWLSFRHHLDRGLGAVTLEKVLEKSIGFTVGHLALFSLISTIVVWAWVWRKKRAIFLGKPSKGAAIVSISVVTILFFTLCSFRGKIADPHWVDGAYLGLFMVFANHIARRIKQEHVSWNLGILKWWRRAIYLNLSLGVFLLIHCLTPLVSLEVYEIDRLEELRGQEDGVVLERLLTPYRGETYYSESSFNGAMEECLGPEGYEKWKSTLKSLFFKAREGDPTRILFGWNEIGEQVGNVLKQKELFPVDYVMTREYQLASLMALFIPGQPKSFTIERAVRNQWSPYDKFVEGKSIAVCYVNECPGFIHDAKQLFPAIEFVFLDEFFVTARQRKIGYFRVYFLKPVDLSDHAS